MHIIEKNVYVENVDDQIVVTSLTNTKMPLIRYCLGDNIELDYSTNCKCGNPASIIKKISGKKGVSFYNNGELITEKKLAYCIERTNSLFFDCIVQYQVSKQRDDILFVLYIEKKFENWEDQVLYQLKLELSNVDINADSWIFKFQTTNIKNLKYKKFKNLIIE